MGLFSGGIGGILGGAAGFMIGGPAGAAYGAAIGGSIGGGMDANETNMSLASNANELQYNMFKQGMDFNSAEAQKQRDWSQRQSAIAVRKRMYDLKEAGLNPILAGQFASDMPQGGVASSPGVPSAKVANVNDVITPAISSANEYSKAKSIVGLQGAQQRKVGYEINQIMADTDFKLAATQLTDQQKYKLASDIAVNNVKIKDILETTRGKQQLNDAKALFMNFIQESGLMELSQGAGMGFNELLDTVVDQTSKTISGIRGFQFYNEFRKWMYNTVQEYKNR